MRTTYLSGLSAVIAFLLIGGIALFIGCGGGGDDTEYSVTLEQSFGGVIEANRTKAKYDDRVIINSKPIAPNLEAGYVVNDATTAVFRLKGILLAGRNNAENTAVRGSGDNRNFFMPRADVTVTPEFEVAVPNLRERKEGFEEGTSTFEAYGNGYFAEANGEGATAAGFFDAAQNPPHIMRPTHTAGDPPTFDIITNRPGFTSKSGRMDFNLGTIAGATARFGRNNLPDLDLKPNNYASTLYFWARATVPGKYNVIMRMSEYVRGDGTPRDVVGEFTINAANTWEHINILLTDIGNPASFDEMELKIPMYYLAFQASSATGFANETIKQGSLWIDEIEIPKDG